MTGTCNKKGRELKGKDDDMLRVEVFSTVTSDNDKSNILTEEKSARLSDNEVCNKEKNKDIAIFSLIEKFST